MCMDDVMRYQHRIAEGAKNDYVSCLEAFHALR